MPLDRAPYLAGAELVQHDSKRDGLRRRERYFGPLDAEPLLAFEAERRELSLGKLAKIGAGPVLPGGDYAPGPAPEAFR